MHAVESVRRESSRRTLAAFQTSRSNLTACDPFSSPPAPFLCYFCLATRSVRATARCVGSLGTHVLCERLNAAPKNASTPRNAIHQAEYGETRRYGISLLAKRNIRYSGVYLPVRGSTAPKKADITSLQMEQAHSPRFLYIERRPTRGTPPRRPRTACQNAGRKTSLRPNQGCTFAVSALSAW